MLACQPQTKKKPMHRINDALASGGPVSLLMYSQYWLKRLSVKKALEP
jgi:hypothetical protein